MWLDRPPIFFIKYWLLQGLLHMNWGERLHRLGIEASVAVGLCWLSGRIATSTVSWVWCVLAAHTLNALLNGQPVAVWRHVYGRISLPRLKQDLQSQLESMVRQLEQKRPPYIRHVIVMGSIARGELRPTSDVELAVVAMPGPWNLLRASNYLALQRLRAFFARFPLDAYVYGSWEELERKMRVEEEPPLFLYGSRSGVTAGAMDEILDELRERIRVAEAKPKAPRVILVGAGGGHLTEALLAVEGVRIKRYIATFCLPHTRQSLKGDMVYCLVDPHGDLLKYLRNFFQSLVMVLRVRPQAVLSSGGGMTIAPCLIAKLVGAKVIYVESGARVHTLSRTGRFLYRFADLFIVQWQSLAEKYPKAIYGGVLL
jgi:predicted nucleotidyltransferase